MDSVDGQLLKNKTAFIIGGETLLLDGNAPCTIFTELKEIDLERRAEEREKTNFQNRKHIIAAATPIRE